MTSPATRRSITHKLDFTGLMQDYAVCGTRKTRFQYTGIPTNITARWRSVTCKRCLNRRKK